MRTDAERVRDILDAIARIEDRTRDDRAAFLRDEMLQIWVVHHLEILGEAAKGLSDEFRRSKPKIPWNAVARMRDWLVHGYWTIDLDAVWQVVVRDLPELRSALEWVTRPLDGSRA